MHRLLEYVRQFGRFQRNARLYLISNALSGVTTGILLVLYNLYLVSLGYHTDFIGIVLFVAAIGAGIAIFPAGVCVDLFGGKPVLIFSNLLIGAAGVGQILFRQPIPLLVSGFIAGIGGAFTIVVNAPFLSLNSTQDERSHLFSLNIVLGLVTTVLGNIIGGVLPLWFRSISWLMALLPSWLAGLLAAQPDPRSYQLSLLFAGVIAGPSLIPLFMLKNNRPVNGIRDRVGAGDGMGGEGALVAARGGEPEMSPKSMFPFLRASIRTTLRSPILLLVLVQALIGTGAGLFIPYFNIYFVQYLKASTALFGLLNGGATAITALLTLGAPWLARRIGKVNSIALTQLSSIPLLVTLGLIPLLPLASTLYLFRQGLMDMSMGVLQVYSMEAAPERYRGLANSSYQAAFYVPWALMAPLGGLLIAHFGYPAVFISGAICYILASATLYQSKKRVKTELPSKLEVLS